jgi:hypothetical protein
VLEEEKESETLSLSTYQLMILFSAILGGLVLLLSLIYLFASFSSFESPPLLVLLAAVVLRRCHQTCQKASRKVLTVLNNLLFLVLVIMSRKKRARTNAMLAADQDGELLDAARRDQLGSIKLFEFTRIRCRKKSERVEFELELSKKLKLDGETRISGSSSNNSNVNVEFGIPGKRSGHRAVCNEEHLWIWGGYCPVSEDNADEDDEDRRSGEGHRRSPLYPEVVIYHQLFFKSNKIFKNEIS